MKPCDVVRVFSGARTLTYITTYECGARCAHCLMDCSPEQHEKLGFDEMASFLCRVMDLGLSLQTVVFTGGECTRLGDDLLDMISYASSRGLATRIVTNAEWATTDKESRVYLGALHDAGLDEVNISFDDYHARWVPLSNIKRVWELTREFSFTTVAVATCEHGLSKVTPEYLCREFGEDVPKYYGSDGGINVALLEAIEGGERVRFISNNRLYRLGRARGLHDDVFCQELGRMALGGCNDCCRDIVVTPEFHVALCCGMRPGKGSFIDIGSAKLEESISATEQLIDKYLEELGPYCLLDLLRCRFPHDVSSLEWANSPCEACETASRFMANLASVDEIYNAMRDQLDAEHQLDSILEGVISDAQGKRA